MISKRLQNVVAGRKLTILISGVLWVLAFYIWIPDWNRTLGPASTSTSQPFSPPLAPQPLDKSFAQHVGHAPVPPPMRPEGSRFRPLDLKPPKPGAILPGHTEPELPAPGFTTPENAPPRVAAPGVLVPELAQPALNMPESIAPGVAAPELGAPDLTTPQLRTPEGTTPELFDPQLTGPEITTPNSLKPMTIKEYTPPMNETMYREISSISTPDGKYSRIHWGDGIEGVNPSILPHPTVPGIYIMAAQRQAIGEAFKHSQVVFCNAVYEEGLLYCIEMPSLLPIEPTPPCKGDELYGPHDVRMFYGPEAPYITYGSHSAFSCHGMWVHDLRALVPELDAISYIKDTLFSAEPKEFLEPVDIQRPPPYDHIEKNYFLFWDLEGSTYVHQDLWPERVLTTLFANGSVSSNLSPKEDQTCLSRLLPNLSLYTHTSPGIKVNAIHQSSNSLLVTLCSRDDPECVPSSSNTVVMAIFQHKEYYESHALYHPYALIFNATAPFNVLAVSRRALWINGRDMLTRKTDAIYWRLFDDALLPKGHTEMFFVTSINWMTPGSGYHGFIDDDVLVGFGIEDTRSAVIDVKMEDLLQELNWCAEDMDGNDGADAAIVNATNGTELDHGSDNPQSPAHDDDDNDDDHEQR
ncbi:hypothetical protein PV10_05012 [Exophiala mesophila]|uniref:Uncharacterized protein n=1 Tax=Exophiala mesophila TaxID=212818 RepID=A0A0D1XZX7_EXOME|nr:uncharacterized protein PV10_05012 [Exophiala mesophila]KIV93826.1 hypothetical protein PV10_05012 [Exophiala mesophila]